MQRSLHRAALAGLSVLFCDALIVVHAHGQQVPQPGSRTMMDSHNCYPYFEWWGDRIDRALSAGTPLAIEQDLGWYTDPATGKSWSVVTHGDPITGEEPTMERYFFARVRPIVEQALKDGNKGDWPLITLNLDFKDNKPEHLAAVLALLRKYQPWLTSAGKSSHIDQVQTLDIKPILVLTGQADAQQTVFYDQLHEGERVLAFGAIHTENKDPQAAPEILDSEKANNYRRWWNNPWRVVESGGQPHAGEWTPEKMNRLRALVQRAHANGLWIRFYTLDGATQQELSCTDGFVVTTSVHSTRLAFAGGLRSLPTSTILRPISTNSWALKFASVNEPGVQRSLTCMFSGTKIPPQIGHCRV